MQSEPFPWADAIIAAIPRNIAIIRRRKTIHHIRMAQHMGGAPGTPVAELEALLKPELFYPRGRPRNRPPTTKKSQ